MSLSCNSNSHFLKTINLLPIAAQVKKSISTTPDNTLCATNKSPIDKCASDNFCINKAEAKSDCFKQNSSGQPLLNSNCEAESGGKISIFENNIIS